MSCLGGNDARRCDHLPALAAVFVLIIVASLIIWFFVRRRRRACPGDALANGRAPVATSLGCRWQAPCWLASCAFGSRCARFNLTAFLAQFASFSLPLVVLATASVVLVAAGKALRWQWLYD